MPRSFILAVAMLLCLAAPTRALADVDLTATLASSPEPVAEEGTVTYAYAVKNNGSDAAQKVTVDLRFPAPPAMGFNGASPSQGNGSLNLLTNELRFNFGTVAPGATATIDVTWKANNAGTFTIPSTVVSGPDPGAAPPQIDPDTNPADNDVTVTTTVQGLTAAPMSAGSLAVGLISAAQAIRVTNNAMAAAPLGAVTLSGPDAADFLVLGAGLDTCSGVTLATAASCTVVVRFAPGAVGARAGTLAFTPTSGPVDPLALALSGDGVAPPTVAGPTGSPGPAGPAGPVGPAGPSGPARPRAPVSSASSSARLVLAPTRRRLRVRSGRRVSLTYAATTSAKVRLDVMRGKKRVARVSGRAHRGANVVRWRARTGRHPAKAGSYTLRLTARSGTQQAFATVRLRVLDNRRR